MGVADPELCTAPAACDLQAVDAKVHPFEIEQTSQKPWPEQATSDGKRSSWLSMSATTDGKRKSWLAASLSAMTDGRKKSRISVKTLAALTLRRLSLDENGEENHDPALMGSRMDADFDAVPTDAPEGPASWSKFKAISVPYAGFILGETKYLAPQVVLGCGIVLMAAFSDDYYASLVPDHEGTHKEMTYKAWGESQLYMIPWGIAFLFGFYGPYLRYSTLWSPAKVRPIAVKTLLPGYVITFIAMFLRGIVYGRVDPTLPEDEIFKKRKAYDGLSTLIYIFAFSISQGTFMRGVAKLTNNWLLWKVDFPVSLYMTFLGLMIRNNASKLVHASDHAKMFLVVVVIPLACEVMMVGARVTARSLKHNHPSTTICVIGSYLPCKHMYGRFFIMMISSVWNVTVVSIILAIMEFFMRSTTPTRDKIMYQCLLGSYAQKTAEETGQEVDVTAAARHPRNKTLRVQTDALESMYEYNFTIVCAVLMCSFNVSQDGTNPPVFEDVAAKCMVQIVVEIVTDWLSVAWMYVCQNEHYMHKAEMKFKGYWYVMSFFPVQNGISLLAMSFLPFIICMGPEVPDGATFVFCKASGSG